MEDSNEEPGAAFFIMYGESIKTLQDELISIMGIALAHSILFRFGFKCGHMSATNMGLTGQGSKHLVEYMDEIWLEMGLARPKSIKENGSNIVIKLNKTLESTYDGKGCDFTRGFLAGLTSSVSGVSYHCTETKCVSSGDKICEFKVSEQKK